LCQDKTLENSTYSGFQGHQKIVGRMEKYDILNNSELVLN